MDSQGNWVQNYRNFADGIYGWPLSMESLSNLNSNEMRLFNIGKIDFRVTSCFAPGRRTVEGGRRVLALLHPRLARLTQRHQLSDGLRTVGACK